MFLNLRKSMACLSLCLGISVSFADGGVSGGGGGSLPANPVSPEAIGRLLNDARAVLFMHFTAWNYAKEDLPYGAKLFDSEKNIFSALSKNRIYRQALGPCIAPDGNGYDGSAPGPVPNSICISIERLAMKLSQENAFVQVYGLVAHEYGHLSGLNEEEATDLQRRVVDSLVGTLPSEATQLLENSYYYKNLPFYLGRIQNGSPQVACVQIMEQMRELIYSMAFGHLRQEEDEDAPFFFTMPADVTQFIGINSRMSTLATSLCAVGAPTEQERASYIKTIDGFFKGKDSVDLADVYLGSFESKPGEWRPDRGQVILRNVLPNGTLNTDLLKLEFAELTRWTQYFFLKLEHIRSLREKP